MTDYQRAGKAVTVPLVIEQGATFDSIIRYLDANGPIDLTGCTARSQARSADGTVLVNLTTENGGIVLGGSAGTIQRLLNDTLTSALPLVDGMYDIELEFPDGYVSRLLQGPSFVSEERTKP